MKKHGAVDPEPKVPAVDLGSMPDDIKLLLVPNPISSKQRYTNAVVHEIFASCCGKMTSLTLLTYIRNQKEERHRLSTRMLDLEEVRQKVSSSKDGNWINVRKHGDAKVATTYRTISELTRRQ